MTTERADARAAPLQVGPASFEPIVVNRPSSGARFPLKVAALNLRGGRRVEAIAASFARPDLRDTGVILLSEADWRTRRSRGREVAAELAAMLEMSFVYAPSWGFPRSDGSVRAFLGEAILSREPLVGVRTAPMAHESSRRRNRVGTKVGLSASVVIGRQVLAIGVTHLERNAPPRFRARQLADYLAAFPSDGPAIVGGDFNTTTIDWMGNAGAMLNVMRLMAAQPRRFRDPVPHEPLFGSLHDAGFEIDGANLALKPTFTFTRFIPAALRPKLDWIALRGVRAVPGSAAVFAPRSSPLGRRASDHDIIACQVITL